MKILSRAEEILLLAIWRLQGNAYGMTIKAYVEEVTGTKWSFGAVYAPLNRLLKKEYIISEKGQPTPLRGGRSKVFYSLTDYGRKALLEVQRVHDHIWMGIPSLESE